MFSYYFLEVVAPVQPGRRAGAAVFVELRLGAHGSIESMLTVVGAA